MAFTIKSITGQIHDQGFGGYPYKIVVRVEIPVAEFNKLCPVMGKARTSMYGPRQAAPRDLGNLVLDVNNAVYKLNKNIPAYNPSIDSNGSSRAKNGVKTMEFVYFFSNHDQAEKLGYEFTVKNEKMTLAKYSQYVQIA